MFLFSCINGSQLGFTLESPRKLKKLKRKKRWPLSKDLYIWAIVLKNSLDVCNMQSGVCNPAMDNIIRPLCGNKSVLSINLV